MAERTADFNDLLRLYKAGDPARALEACLRLMGANGATLAVHRLAGRCASDLGRRNEAIRHFRSALALGPRSAELHVELAQELEGLGRLDEAEAALKVAITLSPSLLVAHLTLGNLLGDRGRIDESIQC